MRLARWTMASMGLAGTAPARTSVWASFCSTYSFNATALLYSFYANIEQRYSVTGGRGFAPRFPLVGRAGKVSASEFRPLLKIVAEPSAQFVRGPTSSASRQNATTPSALREARAAQPDSALYQPEPLLHKLA